MTLLNGFKSVSDTVQKTEKIAESVVKKAWSMLDAATEKMKPSEQISQRAIRNIQGLTQN